MSFDIHAVVTKAIRKQLTSYKDQLLASPEQANELKEEYAAIIKAVTESLNFPQLQAEGVQLILDAFQTFESWGYWTEYIALSETALALELPAEQRVDLYANLGHMNDRNRNFADSLHYLNLGLTLAEEHQLEHCFGLIHHRLMNVHIGLEKPETAQKHGLQALTYLSGSHSKTLAAVHDSLGRVYTRLNNAAMAEKYFREALSSWESLKDYTHLARSYINLGHLFFRDNKPEDAQKCFEASLHASENLSNVLDELNARSGLGIVQYALGNFDEAAIIFREAVDKLEEELGDNDGWYSLRGMLVHNVGNAQLAKGDIQQAIIALNKAKTFWYQSNDNLQMANTIGTIAEAYQANQEWETAVTFYDEALSLLANFPDHPWAIKLTGDFTQAKKTCTKQINAPTAQNPLST